MNELISRGIYLEGFKLSLQNISSLTQVFFVSHTVPAAAAARLKARQFCFPLFLSSQLINWATKIGVLSNPRRAFHDGRDAAPGG